MLTFENMQVDFLIIGQGICGTFLSWYLQQAGQKVLVIDSEEPGSATRTAAGIINPVTGRRIVDTWLVDEVLPFALNAYKEIGHALDETFISQKNIIDFFTTPQMVLAFEERLQQDNRFLKKRTDDHFSNWFQYDFNYGEVDPVYLVNLQTLIPAYRDQLTASGNYLPQTFDVNELKTGPIIRYKNISANHIIFCDGLHSFYQNPYFHLLPFAPNKGEMLLVKIEGLPAENIYKKGMLLAPLGDDLYWMGSSYEWSFTNTEPTNAFYKRAEHILKNWLKLPYTIIDHRAAVRPATLERRPFVGMHPLHPNIGILNGMGTKGCSLAPFFASQLTQHLLKGKTIYPEADISRFNGILSRPVSLQ